MEHPAQPASLAVITGVQHLPAAVTAGTMIQGWLFALSVNTNAKLARVAFQTVSPVRQQSTGKKSGRHAIAWLDTTRQRLLSFALYVRTDAQHVRIRRIAQPAQPVVTEIRHRTVTAT